MLIIHAAIVVFFMILGVAFLMGKGAFLIAGYNTLPQEEKALGSSASDKRRQSAISFDALDFSDYSNDHHNALRICSSLFFSCIDPPKFYYL